MGRFLSSKVQSMNNIEAHATKLRMEVKTHKPAGKAKARAIHDGTLNPLAPAAARFSGVMELLVRTTFDHVI